MVTLKLTKHFLAVYFFSVSVMPFYSERKHTQKDQSINRKKNANFVMHCSWFLINRGWISTDVLESKIYSCKRNRAKTAAFYFSSTLVASRTFYQGNLWRFLVLTWNIIFNVCIYFIVLHDNFSLHPFLFSVLQNTQFDGITFNAILSLFPNFQVTI